MAMQQITIEDIDKVLIDLDYYNNFRDNFLYKSYNKVDYGKKLGKEKFDSFFNANTQYNYTNNQNDENIFKCWHSVLINEKSTEEELFLTCLEIFVWGGVLSGNVKKAIEFYKSKKLKEYLQSVKSLLERKSTITKNSMNDDVIWSSGWTKVYSFMNNDILIYDSRVSAFLNHTLIHCKTHIEYLPKLSKYLFNFGDTKKRKRKVDKYYGFKNSHPSGLNGFNANLISSWIVQLLNDKLNLNKEIRSYERAFFMLGFDIKQIEG